MNHTVKSATLMSAAVVTVLAVRVFAQLLPFADVVRNLRNPDPKVRLDALRLLREAKYPEAVTPIAPLVLDPVNEVQLDAIATELSFFVSEQVKERRMVAFVIEKRNPVMAGSVFDLGPAAVSPRLAPPELVDALLQAIDDDNARVRLDAAYAVGVIARPPLSVEQAQRVIKALDHSDPAVRVAAARVAGRLRVAQAGDALIRAVNDSRADVRYAAMRALGDIHEVRAVTSLSEQLAYYRKGEGAGSALDALARLGQRESVPVFKQYLSDKDPYLRRAAAEGLGRSGDTSVMTQLTASATSDDSQMVRIAMAFALQKLGEHYVPRIADVLVSPKMRPQAESYLVELGPAIAQDLYPRLLEPEPAEREAVADVLGLIGGDASLPALQTATEDRDPNVAAAAKRAIARIKPPHEE